MASQGAAPADAVLTVDDLAAAWQRAGRNRAEDGLLLEALRDADTSGDGKISLQEAAKLAERHLQKSKEAEDRKEQLITAKRIIVALAFLVLLLLIGTLGTSYLAVFALKDSFVGSSAGMPTLTNADGQALAVASSEYVVQNGILTPVAGKCVPGDSANGACTNAVATSDAPKVKQPLSSTMPDKLIDAMKSLSLKNTLGDTIQLSVLSYAKTIQPGAKCGELLTLVTNLGNVILDDFDFILPSSTKTALAKHGFTVTSKLVGTARRVTAQKTEGETIVGMFDFFEDYNWTCKSTQRPLEHMKPPYTFELESWLPCAGDCESEVFPGLKLPGYTTASGKRQAYIKTKETVFASDDYVVSMTESPNAPGILQMTLVNKKTDEVKKQQSTRGVSNRCKTSNRSKEDKALAMFDNYAIAVMGTTEENDRTFRQYRLVSKHVADTKKDHQKALEYWEDAISGEPYKYFMPFYPGVTSITYFKSFSQSLPESFESIVSNGFSSCEPDVGPDMVKVGNFREDDDVLKFYRDIIARGPATLDDFEEDDLKYWNHVKTLTFEDDPVSGGRRLSAAPTPVGAARRAARRALQSKSQTQAMVDHSKSKSLPLFTSNSSGIVDRQLQTAGVKACPFKFDLGKVKIEFCTIGNDAIPSAFTVTFKGGGEWPLGPGVFFTLDGTGGANINLNPVKVNSIDLSVSVGLKLNFGIGECSFTIGGTLNGGADVTDDGGQQTVFLGAGLNIGASCTLIGVKIGPSISGSFNVKWGALFGSTNADDYVDMTAAVTLSFNLFVFTLSVTWTGKILDHQLLQDGPKFSENHNKAEGYWTTCGCGDFLKCSPKSDCSNHHLVDQDDEFIEYENGETAVCGDHKFEYFNYAWDDYVGCPSGWWRCFCRVRQ